MFNFTNCFIRYRKWGCPDFFHKRFISQVFVAKLGWITLAQLSYLYPRKSWLARIKSQIGEFQLLIFFYDGCCCWWCFAVVFLVLWVYSIVVRLENNRSPWNSKRTIMLFHSDTNNALPRTGLVLGSHLQRIALKTESWKFSKVWSYSASSLRKLLDLWV